MLVLRGIVVPGWAFNYLENCSVGLCVWSVMVAGSGQVCLCLPHHALRSLSVYIFMLVYAQTYAE